VLESGNGGRRCRSRGRDRERGFKGKSGGRRQPSRLRIRIWSDHGLIEYLEYGVKDGEIRTEI
jgi:hypothetical protein